MAEDEAPKPPELPIPEAPAQPAPPAPESGAPLGARVVSRYCGYCGRVTDGPWKGFKVPERPDGSRRHINYLPPSGTGEPEYFEPGQSTKMPHNISGGACGWCGEAQMVDVAKKGGTRPERDVSRFLYDEYHAPGADGLEEEPEHAAEWAHEWWRHDEGNYYHTHYLPARERGEPPNYAFRVDQVTPEENARRQSQWEQAVREKYGKGPFDAGQPGTGAADATGNGVGSAGTSAPAPAESGDSTGEVSG